MPIQEGGAYCAGGPSAVGAPPCFASVIFLDSLQLRNSSLPCWHRPPSAPLRSPPDRCAHRGRLGRGFPATGITPPSRTVPSPRTTVRRRASRLCLRRAMLRHGKMGMSHKCTGPSCYRKQGRRNECPSCNRSKERAANKRRWRREYEKMPKSSHWTHLRGPERLGKDGLTPEVIMETKEIPDEVVSQIVKGSVRQAHFKYYAPNTPEARSALTAPYGAWFKVVTTLPSGTLLTAVRETRTEAEGGRPCLKTPATVNNPGLGQ